MPTFHPALVARDIVNAIGDRLTELPVDEVVRTHRLWFAFRLPLFAFVVKVADQLLLLGIHRNHGLAPGLKLTRLAVDMSELRIAIRVRLAFASLVQPLQAIAELV